MLKSGGRIFSRARPVHEPKKTVIGQCVPKAVARNWPRLPATRYLALFLYVISCSKLAAKKKRTGRRNTSEQPNEFLSLFTVLYDAEEQRAMEMNGDGRTKGKRELHRYEFEHTKATDTGLDTSQLPLCRSSFMVHRCKKRVKLPRTYTEALKVSLLRGLPLLYECKMSFVCCSLKFGLSRATLPHRLPWKLVCILAMSFVLSFSRVLRYFASGSTVTVKMVVNGENGGWWKWRRTRKQWMGVLAYPCVHACAYVYDADSRVSRCLDTLIDIGSTKNTFERTSRIALVSRSTIGSSSLDDELRAKKC